MNYEKKFIKYSMIIIITLIYLMILTTCNNILELTETQPSVKDGYGRISINLTGNKTVQQQARTVFPTVVFDKYVYTFTKTDSGGVDLVLNPDSNGFFILEVGSYTVEVKAFIGTEEPYTLVANGVSSQFTVDIGNNNIIEVHLSAVNTVLQGQFSYKINYPADADAEITLLKWPGLDEIILNPVNVNQGNGKSQTLSLDAGSYLLTVNISKNGFYAGVSEAVHINSSLATVYTKEFNNDDLLAVRIPLTSDYIINGIGTFVYNGYERVVNITPKENASPGVLTVYYEGINGTTYAKNTIAPVNVGTYSVTFDVAAVTGWSTATGLPVGNIIIAVPVITINTQPTALINLAQGSINRSLSISASVNPVGPSITYQWYSSTANNNISGNIINGETSASFTIPTNLTTGVYYYYCEVMATGAVSIRSNVSTVNVTVPIIAINTQPTATMNLVQGNINNNLSISASVNPVGPSITYQWYSNTVNNNTGGNIISGATSANFSIPTTITAGVYYYFCEVRATGATSIRSSVATVNIYRIDVSPSNIYVIRGFTQQFTATVNGPGTPDQNVTWSITGAGTGTNINQNGLLTVSSTSGAVTITIRATSIINSNISGTATITVRDFAQWVRTGWNLSRFHSVAVDTSGNIYVAGNQYNSTTYGTEVNLQGSGNVLVKYDSNGTALWAQIGGSGAGNYGSLAIAVDSGGNIYMANIQNGTNIYSYGNGVTAQGSNEGINVVLVKYNSNGVTQWARTLGTGTQYRSVAVDTSGNVYVAGLSNNMIVKYNSNGTAQWTGIVSTGVTQFNSVAADANGNVYAAGSQYGTNNISYGNGVTAQGISSATNTVLVKYNSSGIAQWAITDGAVGVSSRLSSVAVDVNGNIYVAGNTHSTMGDFVPITDMNVILRKYNPSGTFLWSQTLSESGNSDFSSVTTDTSGNVYATGHTTLASNNPSALLVKFDSSGTLQWMRSVSTVSGTSPMTYFYSVAVDSNNNVYTAGCLIGRSTYTYGLGVIVSNSDVPNDMATLVKYRQD